MTTVCGTRKTQSVGRKDAFDRLDEMVIGMMLEADPYRKTKFVCDDVKQFLHLRSTQRELLRRCRGNLNDITTLMYYLDKRGVHMRDVIVGIKCATRHLSLELCKARAQVLQLVTA